MDNQVMWPPEGSLSAQSHDLQIATNCLSHYLLYTLLLPTLTATAALPSTPKASVRVAWAASIGVDIASPHPYGMEIDMDTGEPKDLGTTMNYGQSKVGNVYLSKVLAEQTKENRVVHTAFNPGNLWTGLQRHWFGFAPWFLVCLCSPHLLLCPFSFMRMHTNVLGWLFTATRKEYANLV